MSDRPASACGDYSETRWSRRKALQVGTAGLAGLTLPGLLRAERAAGGSLKGRAKSVIFLHQFGGPNQQETFDMKPSAPAEVRGDYKPISTNVPGVQVCEHLPRMAGVMDKVCLVRSVQHDMKNHNPATYYSLTGHRPPVDDIRLRDSLDLFPAYGSVAGKFLNGYNGMPAFVSYPYTIRDGSVTPGQHASFLGKEYDPLFFAENPNAAGFGLPELTLPAALSPDRLQNRQMMLEAVDKQSQLLAQSATARGIDKAHERALSMLTSPKIREAFDLSREPKNVRDAYGRTTYGQSCLLARRLVEAGARFVNVYFSESIGGPQGGWDVHGFNGAVMWPILKSHLLPVTNQTLPTLISDLDERGLLDETLVVWMGEFGRTPRINKLVGRDHWPQCYTALLAGGGVKRGHVHGASDKIGAFPQNDLVRLEDLAATMFALLGINPASEIRDALGRPFPVSTGEPVAGVMA